LSFPRHRAGRLSGSCESVLLSTRGMEGRWAWEENAAILEKEGAGESGIRIGSKVLKKIGQHRRTVAESGSCVSRCLHTGVSPAGKTWVR
jgi:hypothetical protein